MTYHVSTFTWSSLEPNRQSAASRNVAVCSVKCAKRALLCSILVLSVLAGKVPYTEAVKDLFTVPYIVHFCPLLRFAVELILKVDDDGGDTFFQPILAKAMAYVLRCFHHLSLRFPPPVLEPPYPSLSTSSCLSAPLFFEGQHGEHIPSPTASLRESRCALLMPVTDISLSQNA